MVDCRLRSQIGCVEGVNLCPSGFRSRPLRRSPHAARAFEHDGTAPANLEDQLLLSLRVEASRVKDIVLPPLRLCMIQKSAVPMGGGLSFLLLSRVQD